jgi:hypothetical protein
MSGVDTDWFIAAAADAERIAAVVMEDAGEFDDWPNLHLPLGEMELRALWAAMRGRAVDAGESVAGDLLFESPDGELLVMTVEPEFLRSAAALPSADVAPVAAAWSRAEFSGGFTAAELADLVEQIRAFAGRAMTAKTPVLQLSTL